MKDRADCQKIMRDKILITGSEGLIGTALKKKLKPNYSIVSFDIKNNKSQDICRKEAIISAIKDCKGIIHLAAVSRVAWAEKLQDLCWKTNVFGTENVINAALENSQKPWLIYASSREVYGQPQNLPVSEELPVCPINIYGKSKAAGEKMTFEANTKGLRTAILRFSNVYGHINDHADRVIPAFIYNSLLNKPLRVEGSDNAFDFTHIDDTVNGIAATIKMLEKGESLSPTHFLTGTPTKLIHLAKMIISIATSQSQITYVEPRMYDVSSFYGTPCRAKKTLNWEAKVCLKDGIRRLMHDFQESLFPNSNNSNTLIPKNE